ncbi:MAG: GNAT family N-acetyltransferase [Candidatus Arsenophonus phytopathogenicus]
MEVEVMEQALHIWELSVDSRWQRKGIGKALLQKVIIQAKQLNCDHVTLTTFCDVSWNGVYYQKLGFTIISVEKLTLSLQAILKKEVAYGFTAS